MNKWLFTILAKAISFASPVILENLRQNIDELCKKAAATPNPWDDIITGLMQTIVGKPGEIAGDEGGEVS